MILIQWRGENPTAVQNSHSSNQTNNSPFDITVVLPSSTFSSSTVRHSLPSINPKFNLGLPDASVAGTPLSICRGSKASVVRRVEHVRMALRVPWILAQCSAGRLVAVVRSLPRVSSKEELLEAGGWREIEHNDRVLRMPLDCQLVKLGLVLLTGTTYFPWRLNIWMVVWIIFMEVCSNNYFVPSNWKSWECSPGKEVPWNILSLFTTSGMLFLEVSLVAFLLHGNSVSGTQSLGRTFVISGLIVALDLLLKVVSFTPRMLRHSHRVSIFIWEDWGLFRQCTCSDLGYLCSSTTATILIRSSGTCGLYTCWCWQEFTLSSWSCTTQDGRKGYLVCLSCLDKSNLANFYLFRLNSRIFRLRLQLDRLTTDTLSSCSWWMHLFYSRALSPVLALGLGCGKSVSSVSLHSKTSSFSWFVMFTGLTNYFAIDSGCTLLPSSYTMHSTFPSCTSLS